MLRQRRAMAAGTILALVTAFAGCGGGAESARSVTSSPQCAPDNAGLQLPDGFCALVVADGLGRARHLTVAPNGDIFVAVAGSRTGGPGGVVALRDTTGDGVTDLRVRFGDAGGTGIALRDGYLYLAPNWGVLRYPLASGELRPSGPPDTIVSGLPETGNHTAKSIAFGSDGALYVNHGSASNACQVQTRTAGSPGQDPCPELEVRAGIWRYDANRVGQTQADGVRFATGIRNAVGLAYHDGQLYATQHGRDQLFQLWGALYDAQRGADLPAEEMLEVNQGDDFGWPYCYYDQNLAQRVLAPEYGGDGEKTGRCSDKKRPIEAFPGHWGPDGLLFYTGTQFPETYRGGAFIAFHGSWNRAPLPQAGYNVTFVPFQSDQVSGDYEVFADGFASGQKDPRNAAHRPSGLGLGPDGSLYVSDDTGGTIYRIIYRGG